MAAGFEQMRGSIRILLSESDLTAREFEAHGETPARWAELTRRGNVELAAVPGADHIFPSADLLQPAVNLSLSGSKVQYAAKCEPVLHPGEILGTTVTLIDWRAVGRMRWASYGQPADSMHRGRSAPS
jgi:hypothetical protein